MKTGEYILAIDQGTSSTKTIVFDRSGNVLAKGSVPLKTYYIEGGLVEQDPDAIYRNVLDSVKECFDSFTAAGYSLGAIKTCGISNQRETFIVWDENGEPLHNAVVWQCKRSISVCRRLHETDGMPGLINSKTGLIIDPYFSGTKLIWLNENESKVSTAIKEGRAYFGTVDTWLLYKLTSGKRYLTDHTNASRTLLFNLTEMKWDEEILQQFGLDNIHLPDILTSAADFGETNFNGLLSEPIKINSMIGDSHAAAFGEGCFSAGTAKATMGTGCSVMMNIGNKIRSSAQGMMTTICWSIPERVDYALEGVIVTCGATMEWLKNDLGIFQNIADAEAMATAVNDNNGVYLVPAFSGLGAPHWEMDRKAVICGLTLDCNKNHIVRAGLESIAYQIKDVVLAMNSDAGLQLTELMVNGGITSNKFVQQFTADLLGCKLINRGISDVSALGAALLAGLQAEIYSTLDDITALGVTLVTYTPTNPDQTLQYYKQWVRAIKHYAG